MSNYLMQGQELHHRRNRGPIVLEPRWERTTRLCAVDSAVDRLRHYPAPGCPTAADHAVRQRFTGVLPDFLLPFGRLISVRSVVQLYPGPPQLSNDLAPFPGAFSYPFLRRILGVRSGIGLPRLVRAVARDRFDKQTQGTLRAV
jgi:hypothetical protein